MNKYFLFLIQGQFPNASTISQTHYWVLLIPVLFTTFHGAVQKYFFPCFDASPSFLRDLMSGRSLLALVGSRTTSRGDTVSLFILFPVLQNNYCGLNFGSDTDQFGRVLQPGLGSRFYKETDKPAISASPQLSTKVARVRKKNR